MLKKSFLIENKLGLHARAASKFVQLTNSFSSDIEIEYNENFIDGKSIMCIISMSIPQNGEINVIITGNDEEIAMKRLEEFLKEEFLDV